MHATNTKKMFSIETIENFLHRNKLNLILNMHIRTCVIHFVSDNINYPFLEI